MALKRNKKGKIKRRLGDRFNGRRIRTLSPMAYMIPYIMNKRSNSLNMFRGKIEIESIEAFLRQCKNSESENLRGMGFMHLIVAAYVRTVSQKPAINRFIAGRRIYARTEITLSMTVKKVMELNADEDVIKVNFEPTDTLLDVYSKMEEQIAKAKAPKKPGKGDWFLRKLFGLPTFIIRGFVAFLKGLDYFGIMPRFVHRASPFHGSIYLTNLGSLGIPPVFHHLYDFGDVPIFIAFGSMYREKVIDKNGEEKVKKYIDYTVTMDERITDGHYFASALKTLEHCLRHPEELLTPPETVVDDIE